MPTVPQLVNPSLAWDDETPILNGVPVEQPTGWHVAQPDATHENTTLGMYHRPRGFGIDANFKTGVLILSQPDVHFPAGTYALQIDLLSHVQRDKEYDASLHVAIVSRDVTITGRPWWVDNNKGNRTLYALVRAAQPITGMLQLRYTVHYASVLGEMQIQRVQFTDTLPAKPHFQLTIPAGLSENAIDDLLPAIDDLRTRVGLARAIQRRLVDNAAVQNDLNQQLLTALQKQEAATERLYQLIKTQ